ncbi:hypothetical protein DPMN_063643 [Dreissena polymorpha]|uniref:SRCR domain-containing protein n=1 Tax=Dreissena polymorpha TaxID=45954 RepID=A0A9D4HKC7_DREPO|nr:hypothetical protein DPMN_063643 [Dreissena polymorpha]
MMLSADGVAIIEEQEDTEIYRAINDIEEDVTNQQVVKKNNSEIGTLVKKHFKDITNSISSDRGDVDGDVGTTTAEKQRHDESRHYYTTTTAPTVDFHKQRHDVDSGVRNDQTTTPNLGFDKSIHEMENRQRNDPARTPTVDVHKATHEAGTLQQTDPTIAPVDDFNKRGHEAGRRKRHDPAPATTQIPQTPLDPTDTFLLDGILDIVDAKFETLNKRLTALERGISNVQYYNVRSFRVVNTHLHAVDTILHSLHTGMSQAELRSSQLDQKVAEINVDVKNFASTNSRMFQALEENTSFYLSGIQTAMFDLKRSVDQTNKSVKELKNDTHDLKEMIFGSNKSQSEMLANGEKLVVATREVMQAAYHILNATLAIKETTSTIEIHTFSVSKTIEEVARNVSVITKDADEIKTSVNVILTNITNSNNGNPKQDISKLDNGFERVDNKTGTEDDHTVHMTCAIILELLDERLQSVKASIESKQQNIQTAYERERNDFFQTESQTLLRAIEQVNQTVLHSLTLYNHTGNLIKRILFDTQNIAKDQISLRDNIVGYLLNGTFELFNSSVPEFLTFGSREKKVTSSPIKSDGECISADPFLQELSLLFRNGSQLFELMTDMVEASSSTVKLSLDKFNSEVSKLANVREEITGNIGLVINKSEINNINQLADLRNTTDYILMLADAIASNTGWIPYVYHRVKYVESQVNKTLDIVNNLDSRTQETLLIQKANMAFIFKPLKSTMSDEMKEERQMFHKQKTTMTASDIEATTLDPFAYIKGTHQAENRFLSGANNASRNQLSDSTINEMMEFVYRTNKKVDRIIPALTHLLGEPEPFIALLDGNTDKEGRVEIYHKGEWGTIPRNIDHNEASYICRKLGYFGGVSVGSGFFGSGSGAFWELNVTCLRTSWCDSVSHVTDPSAYSHGMDVGVMCDHMIRLTKSNEEDETELSRQSGRLEIYHQNYWVPVCFKSWGHEETEVVCKQLGFREGAASSEKDETMMDSYSMANVTCTGSENRLDACAFDGFKLNGCTSSEYVSVFCI